MNKLEVIISTSRPKTLFASLGPVIVGLSLAFYNQNTIKPFIAFLTILCALLLQMSSNFINDYYDGIRGVDTNERLGPKRLSSQGEDLKSFIKLLFISSLSLAFILGCVLMYHGGATIIVIGLSSILFSYLYTGGPIPLSYIALGELLALVFFGPVAIYGTYFLQTLTFDISPLALGISIGFVSAAIMGINNLRDIETDKKTTKRTIAIFLGEKSMRYLIVVFIILSLSGQVYLIQTMNYPKSLLLSALVPLLFIKTWKRVIFEKVSSEFNNILANTGKYLFVLSLVISIILIYENLSR